MYRPVSINGLVLPGNLFLAPVAGYTDRAFRSICIELGADFTYTELISAEAVARGNPKTLPMLSPGNNETRYGIQLFGADPEVMYRAVQALAPYRPALIDINAGCPVPKVVKTGAGSALMRNPLLFGKIVSATVRASQAHLGGTPVTVKMRSGWDADSLNYAECSRIAADAGAALVTLHPRTRAQGYAGTADWEHIADLVSRLDRPVAGSGDLFTPSSAAEMLKKTQCAAALFARGALGNPFIFLQTRSFLLSGTYTQPRVSERLETGFRQLLLSAQDCGEKTACREMRKHFCAYTKGAPGGALLRNRLVRAETIAAYQEILAQYHSDEGFFF
ncbi:MAG: tRNA dihydrouridine synthase DusB [Spirochaetaceae bacterium]|jgi:nifR3 family TIM-barrel protein|nr:tRNA dihydrouridine synthase DusB [Spirochaetaceae bacterium]